MGSATKIDKDNIITATIEELNEDERKAYLVAEEHFKAQFLKGSKKDRGGLVKRVHEFVMPSFKLNNNQVEEIPNVSIEYPNLLKQLSLMMDQKISDAQKSASDILVTMSDEIDALKKKGKNVDSSYSSDVLKPSSSAVPTPISKPLYGMLSGYFAG